MPFFLAVASPAFGGSALTTHLVCTGATGATKALAPESSSSERNWQRMIYQKRVEGCRSAQKSSKFARVALKASPVGVRL